MTLHELCMVMSEQRVKAACITNNLDAPGRGAETRQERTMLKSIAIGLSAVLLLIALAPLAAETIVLFALNFGTQHLFQP